MYAFVQSTAKTDSTFSIHPIFDDLFNTQFNFTVHSINTRKKMQLHRPTAHFSSYQMCAYHARIKIFNTLPAPIAKSVKDKKHCVLVLKRYLIYESLYSNNEYLNYQHEIKLMIVL